MKLRHGSQDEHVLALERVRDPTPSVCRRQEGLATPRPGVRPREARGRDQIGAATAREPRSHQRWRAKEGPSPRPEEAVPRFWPSGPGLREHTDSPSEARLWTCSGSPGSFRSSAVLCQYRSAQPGLCGEARPRGRAPGRPWMSCCL